VNVQGEQRELKNPAFKRDAGRIGSMYYMVGDLGYISNFDWESNEMILDERTLAVTTRLCSNALAFTAMSPL
jgi:hypothetical protein